MKHTPLLIDKLAASAATFVFTLSLGYGVGEIISGSIGGDALGGYILRTSSSSSVSSTESSSSRSRKRTVQRRRMIRGINRAKIVRPSTRRQTGATLRRASTNSPRLPIKASCGDKLLITDLGEQCDDGNTVSGDGCSAKCMIEPGFTCAGRPSICASRCGDRIVTPVEKCDDGDLDGGDGCSALCKIEFGFVCSGTPSVCEPTPYCGDGVKALAEECDDGNSVPGDGCYACKTE